MTSINRTRLQLAFAACLIAVVWQLPYGRLILYPLSLLGTFFHEMGHGLMALALGNNFSHLVMHSDGSGMAHWSGSGAGLGVALVAAGGLVGPSVAGSFLLMSSKTMSRARWALIALTAFMLVSALIWVRNAFGLVFVLSWAAAFAAVARFGSERTSAFVLQIVGVTMCAAIFSDINYMFSEGAEVNGTMNPSDSAQMAQALFLPYWFWGALVALFSLIAMAAGIAVATGLKLTRNKTIR